ncbi:hypothetical protein BCR42DRAFT_397319 [Absidia repens]|uniref:Heterokaryon incompatibility domain-containing protein n=1 Tax=Absidia repens TaxID=90262 RepID=A0A1X2I1L6_9FUNG|nr:hypothetical protein BCR42DRAFT_397319 [Absidia repens]
MTHDNQLGHFFKDLLGIGTKKPFHIVLVDIKKAAKNREIHCVEKPLDESNGEDLNYVALSYRWGEWQETLIDTEVGYTASITSFDLEDFYYLCGAMAGDPDLCSIQYVWVDVICVDQVNHERRKATIYQMSNIYEHAAYILAVPDLHSTYLRNAMLKNKDIMDYSRRYSEYLYHLIHGNYENLAAIDESFLDDCSIPKDTALRELLTKKTDHFAEAFMKYDDIEDERIQLDEVLNQICTATHQPPCPSTNNLNSDDSNPSSNGQTQIKYMTNLGKVLKRDIPTAHRNKKFVEFHFCRTAFYNIYEDDRELRKEDGMERNDVGKKQQDSAIDGIFGGSHQRLVHSCLGDQ